MIQDFWLNVKSEIAMINKTLIFPPTESGPSTRHYGFGVYTGVGVVMTRGGRHGNRCWRLCLCRDDISADGQADLRHCAR